jgi:hypothetical protein
MKYTLKEEDKNTLNYLCDLDLQYMIDEAENITELEEAINEAIGQEEVIYHYNAMKILSEEDQSLQESVAIASEYGIKLEDITSETLATILLQTRMYEEVSDLLEIIEQ